MADTQRTTRSMNRLRRASPALPLPCSGASSSLSAISAAAARLQDTRAAKVQQGPTTRLRAAQEAAQAVPQTRKRTRAAAAASSAGQQLRQEQQPTKRKCMSVLQLALDVLNDPQAPQADQRLAPLLEELVTVESDKLKRYLNALFRIADEAPTPLLEALLSRQHVLQHILWSLHSHQDPKLTQHYAVVVLALFRAVAVPIMALSSGYTTAQGFVLPLLSALLAQRGTGLLHLLQAMDSSNAVVRVAATTAVSMLVQVTQTTAPPAAAEQLVDAVLDPQQQGLSLILHALCNETSPIMPISVTSSDQALRCLALMAPEKLLAALLIPQQRRGLQMLLRALDSNDLQTAACVRTSLQIMLGSAQAQQVQQLIAMLMRLLQRGSTGAGHLLLGIAQTAQGPAQMAKHIKVLSHLVPVPGPCQTLVAASLWTVAHNSDEAIAVLAASDPAPLLQAILQGGDPATLVAGAVCLLALTDAGKRTLVSRIPELLASVQQQHSSIVASMAMRAVGILSVEPDWAQEAVLDHIDQVLDVLLQQQHVEAAAAAGSIVLNLLLQPAGLDKLCQAEYVDRLVQGVQQRGPGTAHAARALAQLAANRQPTMAMMLRHPARLEMIHDMQEILVGLSLADSEFVADPLQAYTSLAPVYWITVAASACQIVPGYVAELIQALQRPELTMPAFEAITFITFFKDGLLALAPHMQAMQAAMSAERFQHDQGLQSYVFNVLANIRAAVRQLKQQQAVAEGRLHYAALQLAAVHARYRRRPRTRKLQAHVLIWAKNVGQLSACNEKLKEQLAAACTPSYVSAAFRGMVN